MKNTEEKIKNIKAYFDFMLNNIDKNYNMNATIRSFKLPSSLYTFLCNKNFISSRYFDGNKKAYTFVWDGNEELINNCLEWMLDDCKYRVEKNNQSRRRKTAMGYSPDFRVDRFVRNMY